MPELWQRRTPVAAFAVLAIIMAGYLPAVAQRECPPAASDVERGRADDSTVLSREAEAGSVDVQSPVWHAMITNLPGDWARGAEATIRPAGLQTFAGVALLTAALVAADGSTYRSTQDLIGRNPWMRSGSDVFQQVGNGRTHFGIAAAFGIVGFLADDAFLFSSSLFLS